MGLRERLEYVIDVTTDGATKGFGSFKTAVADADGVVGKAKAGIGSLITTMGPAGLIGGAGAAAGAIGAFAIKSMNAFTETAKAAIDLSTSTGLSVEASSRWIALGDDYQVTAEALATGLGKVSKTLDADKWKNYGIATRDAAGEARPVNDILLDTFDMLSKVTNETERARIGQELFGKGYQSLTPLLGHTREEYEKLLEAQKSGQVITEEEAKKAERARLAMDELHDSLQEFTLFVGEEVAPMVADFVEDMAKIRDAVGDVTDAINKIPLGDKVLGVFKDQLEGTINPLHRVDQAIGKVSDAGKAIKGLFGGGGGGGGDDTVAAAVKATSTASDLYAESLEMLAAQQHDSVLAEIGVKESRRASEVQMLDYVALLEGRAADVEQDRQAALAKTTEAERKHRDALDDASDAMERRIDIATRLVGGDIAVREAQREANQAAADLTETLANQTLGLGEAGAAIDTAASSQLNAASAAAEYRAQQMEANGQTVDAKTKQQLFKEELQKLSSQLTGPLKAAIDGYIADLGNIPTNITTHVTVNRDGDIIGVKGAHARGGTVASGPGLVLLGEEGAELAELPGGTRIHDAAETKRLLSGSGGTPVDLGAGPTEVHLHIHAGALIHESQLGQLFNRALTAWQRNGGRVTFTAKAS